MIISYGKKTLSVHCSVWALEILLSFLLSKLKISPDLLSFNVSVLEVLGQWHDQNATHFFRRYYTVNRRQIVKVTLPG